MDGKQNRKSLTAAYKEKRALGGVAAVVCTLTGKRLLLSGADLRGMQNRFDFSKATGSCVSPRLQSDWNRFGADAFSFEVLETLEQQPTQDAAAFRADLKALEELWRERCKPEELYG